MDNSGDYDDLDPNVSPGATEVCNTIDDDCDSAIDDADDSVDASSGVPWYTDADSDGYGAGTELWSCEIPVGGSAVGEDCDDSSAAVSPGATEVCNSLDDDCDGGTDDADSSLDASTAMTWFADADLDGYGAGEALVSCVIPVGGSALSTDCDDAEAAVSPDAVELCNSLDDDCDGAIDDADSSVDVGAGLSWYTDADADGFGAGAATVACAIPVGGSALATDCDDASAATFPGAAEVCNTVDDDCDGDVDDADASVDVSTGLGWYVDSDEDLYGAGTQQWTCEIPVTGALAGTDCDDGDATIFPGADETCDGLEEDCDSLTDGCDTLCGATEGAWSLDCDALCDAGDDASGADCDEICDATDSAAGPDCLGAPVVTLSPASPDTDDTLSATADISGVVWAWTVDGVAVPALDGLADVPAASTTRGEVWQARATGGGLTGMASITIGNALPTATVSLSPVAPAPSDTIVAVALGADSDGDAVSFTYEWTVDGSVVAETSDTLDGPTWLDSGSVVSVTVTPNDGAEDGVGVTASATAEEQCTALAFGASGGRALVPSASDLALSSTYTVEAWAYPETGGGTYRRLLDAETATAAPWRIQMNTDTLMQLKVQDGNATNATLTLNAWQHIAAVYASGLMTLYIDGISVTSSSFSSTPGGSGTPLNIGSNASAGQTWRGMIGPVRLSRSARYAGSFTPTWGWTTDSDTIGLWNFDEGSGTVLGDSSGNGHDAAISTAAWTSFACP